MNKTIDISLAGLLFHLEESAYYKLKNYLQHVRNSLKSQEDIDEIMNEVEARIAELLMQKQKNPNEVVNEKQIDEIIEIIGKPEDFEEEEEKPSPTAKIKKSLFRDPDHAMIGGVAAGFAHYLGIDVTLMRIIFLILLFVSQGSFILIYLLLWMIIPKARTVSDKLKMKGEKVNLDNIVENVSSDPGDKENPRMGGNLERVGAGLGEVLLKLIGVLLVFISGTVLLGLIISAFAISPLSDLSIIIDNDASVFQEIGMPLMWLNILALLLVGIPFALLFILGLKLLFPHIKTLSRNILLILGTIWIISFIILTVKSISGLAHKSFDARVIESVPLAIAKDTLQLKIQSLEAAAGQGISDSDISLDFQASPDDKFHIVMNKRAEGISLQEARKTAKEMRYTYKLDTLEGSLVLNDEFTYPKSRAYSDYELEIIIKIPKGKAIKISGITANYFFGLDCEEGDVVYNDNGIIHCSSKTLSVKGKKDKEQIKISGDNVNISIGEDGVKIKAKDEDGSKAVIEINEKGVNIHKK